MRKIAIVIVGIVVLLGLVWLESLPITALSIDLTCPDTQPDANCQTRMRALGHLYSQSGGLDNAADWYRRAAIAGDTAAMFHLGWVYNQRAVAGLQRTRGELRGKIAAFSNREEFDKLKDRVLKEKKEGRQIDMAALLGLPTAMPDDVASNAAPAAGWYRLAAEQGYAPAMNNLGELYRHDLIGGGQAASLDWYLAAGRAGNPVAAFNLMAAYSTGPLMDKIEFDRWSNWTPMPGVMDQLNEPTFQRTTRFGTPLDRREREFIRERAARGESVKFELHPMQPDARLPVFPRVAPKNR